MQRILEVALKALILTMRETELQRLSVKFYNMDSNLGCTQFLILSSLFSMALSIQDSFFILAK